MTVAALIPAAGSGLRLGAGRPKALVTLADDPLVVWAVRSLRADPRVTRVIIAAPADDLTAFQESLATAGLAESATVVAGGQQRSSSVAAALAELGSGVDFVLVHDAARPLVPREVVSRVIDRLAGGASAVVPVLPVADTIKVVDPDNAVVSTPDRTALRAVQTPQGFAYDILVRAHASGADATDDAGLVERLGVRVDTVAGHEAAFKITTPTDLVRARASLADTQPARSAAPAPLVGLGVDVHRFGGDGPLWVAGLHWPDEPGLEGHSDADVACHAAADAMLAAAGLGDLGAVFGTTDPQWAGASGAAILTETRRRVVAAGLNLGNLSVQIIGNRPRIGTRRTEAEQVMSAAAGGPVRLSATTTDGLGLTGRGEGLAAMATCLLLPVTPRDHAAPPAAAPR